MIKKIWLKKWGANHFEPPLSMPQLIHMGKIGNISPAPFKLGKKWFVDENAQFIATPINTEPQIFDNDPVVQQIANSV